MLRHWYIVINYSINGVFYSYYISCNVGIFEVAALQEISPICSKN